MQCNATLRSAFDPVYSVACAEILNCRQLTWFERLASFCPPLGVAYCHLDIRLVFFIFNASVYRSCILNATKWCVYRTVSSIFAHDWDSSINDNPLFPSSLNGDLTSRQCHPVTHPLSHLLIEQPTGFDLTVLGVPSMPKGREHISLEIPSNLSWLVITICCLFISPYFDDLTRCDFFSDWNSGCSVDKLCTNRNDKLHLSKPSDNNFQLFVLGNDVWILREIRLTEQLAWKSAQILTAYNGWSEQFGLSTNGRRDNHKIKVAIQKVVSFRIKSQDKQTRPLMLCYHLAILKQGKKNTYWRQRIWKT